MQKPRTANPDAQRTELPAGSTIVSFGIACCACAIILVLVVAVAATL